MAHQSVLAGLGRRRWSLSLLGLLRSMALRRSHLRLMELDDHLLRDVGLTRSEAQSEARKSVWNAPDHWLR
jgi:uncharacterized protein YjiS (DUF1127 family)